MECKDKTVIPSSVQFRDRGFMYFPDPTFIPFIKAVDDKVREIANNDGIKKHSRSIIEIVSKRVKEDATLKQQYMTTVQKKVDSLDGMDKGAIESVYDEFTRKLYNTRLSEFVDSYRQQKIAEKGSATLAGQNLRDSLLSQHTNLKSADTLPNPTTPVKNIIANKTR